MMLRTFALPWLMAIATPKRTNIAFAQPTSLDSLDEALLTDLLEQYSTYNTADLCPAPPEGSTSFSFDWPGVNADSSFAPPSSEEELNFLGVMTHTDSVNANRTWSIRIGSSGNMYSHYTPNMVSVCSCLLSTIYSNL